jgi:uncharacterized protein YdaU (DUF1376 family)
MVPNKKKSDVWMPLYVTDYLADTMHLNTEQHGAYCLLLMSAWKSGGMLPNDPDQLMAITRLTQQKWKISERILSHFFVVSGEFWTQKRVVMELEKAQKITDERSKAGVKAMAKRWQADSKASNKTITNV